MAGFIPGGATMTMNAALAISGLAITVLLRTGSTASRVIGFAASTIAVATIIQHLFQVDFHIDQLVFPAHLDPRPAPGRMSLLTAVAIAATGLSVALWTWPRLARAAHVLASAAFIGASIALLGHLYGVRALLGTEPESAMSLNAMLATALLAVALVTQRPQEGLPALIADPGVAGDTTRRLLPAALLAPALVGWVRLEGELRGFYGTQFGLALMALSCSVLFAGLVWMIGQSLLRNEQTQRAEQKFRSLLESAPNAIVIVDRRGLITLINSETERLFGYTRGELVDQPIERLVPHRLHAVHRAHRGGYSDHPRVRPMGTGQTLHGLRKDGTEFPVEVSLGPLDSPDGRFVTAAIRDVTERVVFEETLKSKNLELENAILAKNRFLARMSHELRTPLNAVIGFTGTLLMRLAGPLTPDQEQHLTIVGSSARHLLSIINDLLDLAKIESGKVEVKLERVSCREVLDEVRATLAPLALAKGLAFEAELPGQDLVLMADRRALVQIVMNLAGNAIKFTDQGGVRLRVRAADDGRPVTSIEVADTGIGIREDECARLFEAFTQLESGGARRHEGTGLGLHISQKLAALLGGRITLVSEPGQGSTFSLLLPAGD